MTTGPPAPRLSNPVPIDLLKEQWKHSIETFRFALGLMVQILGFLVAADAALLAYGLKERVSSVLVIAAIMPLIMIVAIFIISSATVPVVVTAIRTERKFDGLPVPLISSFAALKSPKVLAKAEERPDEVDIRRLGRLPRSAFRGRRLYLILLVGAVAQGMVAVLMSR